MNSLSAPNLAALSPDLAVVPKALRGAKAAREFEASLIASLLESMEKTFATVPGEENLAGGDDYNYLGTQALATGLAGQGGFGIADLISRHLPAHEGKE